MKVGGRLTLGFDPVAVAHGDNLAENRNQATGKGRLTAGSSDLSVRPQKSRFVEQVGFPEVAAKRRVARARHRRAAGIDRAGVVGIVPGWNRPPPLSSSSCPPTSAIPASTSSYLQTGQEARGVFVFEMLFLLRLTRPPWLARERAYASSRYSLLQARPRQCGASEKTRQQPKVIPNRQPP
jgi:hypothetical protein